MTLIGLLWAVFAPLILVVIALVLVPLAKRAGVPENFGWKGKHLELQRLGLCFVVVFVPVAAIWTSDRLEFSSLCSTLAEPTIVKTEVADGFFLDDSTANSFGMRYLQEPGFTWLEARSIYNRNKFTRYEAKDGKITEHEIDQLSAKYSVQSVYRHLPNAHVNEMQITRMDTGEKLAWAADANFDGGRAKWLLGAWGSSHCPNLMTDEGSRQFKKKYRLAWETLRPAN